MIGVDGGSLRGVLLDDPGGTVKREFDGLYFDFPHYNRCGFGEPHASMRRGPHKLIHFFISNRSLLFELSADIGEATDLSAQLESKTLQFRDELMSQLAAIGAERPNESHTWRLSHDGTATSSVLARYGPPSPRSNIISSSSLRGLVIDIADLIELDD